MEPSQKSNMEQTTTDQLQQSTVLKESSEKSLIVEANKGGRPTKFTDETVARLEKAFEDGASIREACRVAQIHHQTYYEWLEQYPEFSDKMTESQEYPDVVAKMNIVRAMKKGDIDTSRWWAERRMKKEFSLRTELTGKDGEKIEPLVIIKDGNSSK